MGMQEFKEILGTLGVLHESIRTTLRDTNTPLAERWAMFKLAVASKRYSNVHSWYLEFAELEARQINYYSDLGIERYSTVDLVDFIGRFEDVWSGTPDHLRFEKADIDSMKESVLQHGFTAFKFDW